MRIVKELAKTVKSKRPIKEVPPKRNITCILGENKRVMRWANGFPPTLFVGKRGPLTVQGLQRIWKASVREAGLPEELSIHCARHTIAVHLLSFDF